MIPIVSIGNLISALFFSGVTLKLYFSYKRTKDEKLRDFLKTFLFLTIVMILITSPGLVFTNLKIIGLIYAVYPFFAFLALAHLGIIPLRIMRRERVRQIFFKGMIGVAFLITLLNLLNWGSAIVHRQDSFIYWEDTRGVTMNIILGIILGLSLLLITIFFLTQGLKSLERHIRIRAFLIAGGLLSLALVAVVNFVLGASAQIYITSLLASFFNVLAALLIFAGIYYKYKPEEISYPPIKKEEKEYPKIQW